MGKTRARKTRAQAIKAADRANDAREESSKAQWSPLALVAKAEELFAQAEWDLCCQFCERALAQDMGLVAALELLGQAELELGKVDEATLHFRRIVDLATPLQPELSSAYLYLAQLVETPLDAVQHFQTALDLLRARLEIFDLPKERPPEQWPIEEVEIRRACSRSLIGMTELYMTDLCFEQDASSRCTAYTDLAIALDPTDADAWATKASVLLSQEQAEDAKVLVLQSLAMWREAEERPPVESRLRCARLLLECDLAGKAVDVLRGIVDDNEENADAWYLLGIALDKGSETGEAETATQLATEARESLETCLRLAALEDHGDEDGMYAHAKELLDKLIAAGVPAAPEDPDDASDEAGWTDDDEESRFDDAMQA